MYDMQWFFILSTIIKAGAEVREKFLHEKTTEGVKMGHGRSVIEGHLPSLIIQVYAHPVELTQLQPTRRQIQSL